MPVITITKKWLGPSIPYTIEKDEDRIGPWVTEINDCVGYELMRKKDAKDRNYILVRPGGGRSESIGFMNGGPQAISAHEKFSMQHELLHALGFHHEQYHRDFPWDDKDPARVKSTNPDRMYSYEKQVKGAWNTGLYKEIGTRLSREKFNPFAADNQLTSRLAAIANIKDVEHFGKCDFDSIMMYPDVRESVLAVLKDKLQFTGEPPFVMHRSGKADKAEYLSNLDVEAILRLYPRKTKIWVLREKGG